MCSGEIGDRWPRPIIVRAVEGGTDARNDDRHDRRVVGLDLLAECATEGPGTDWTDSGAAGAPHGNRVLLALPVAVRWSGGEHGAQVARSSGCGAKAVAEVARGGRPE